MDHRPPWSLMFAQGGGQKGERSQTSKPDVPAACRIQTNAPAHNTFGLQLGMNARVDLGAGPVVGRTSNFAICTFSWKLRCCRLSDMGANDGMFWEHLGVVDGTSTFRLVSWSHFFDFIEAAVFSSDVPRRHSFIWRGQRRADWSLSTTLDRQLGALELFTLSPNDLEKISQEHLERFRYATRGRRGASPAALLENEWWALGQHFGLATPLLDWTRAPFAALYFAFDEVSDEKNVARAIYGLSVTAVQAKTLELQNGNSYEKGRLSIVEIVDPMSDENQRLVSQGGCFTRAPIGTPIESWIANEFEGSQEPCLIRIELPNADRLNCLQALNRMNINHLSLFPDLSGASRSTNLNLEFEHSTGRKHG